MAGMVFQVADIERPLVVGAQVTAAGNKAELEATGENITCLKTGRTIQLHKMGGKEGGVYAMKMWIPIEGAASVVARPGNKK